MPFDVIGWSEAAPGTGTVGLAAALSDTRYTSKDDDIDVKKGIEWLLAVLYAAESTADGAEIRQPSNPQNYQFTHAVDLNVADPLPGITDMRGRPLPLFVEKATGYSKNATDEDTLLAAMVGSGKITQQMLDQVNPTHRIRGQADQTITAVTWTSVTMTWDQNLASGRYAIVGMKFNSYLATLMSAVARVILSDTAFRPGCFVTGAGGDKTLGIAAELPFEKWPLMSEIAFEHDSMPTFEVLSPGALTDHVVELELVKVG